MAKQDQKAARAAPTLARQTTPRVNMAAAPDCDQRAVRRLDYAYSQGRLFRTASLQGRPDRFSAAGLPGWTAFTCVSDSFTMSRSLLCQIWLLGWCLVRSVGCKVGLHPVLEPKTEGRQGRRFTKPPPMPQKGLVRHVLVDWLQWRLNSHEVLNVFIPGLDVSARQTLGRIKLIQLASACTLLLSVGIN